jgi:hypothetical protein
VEDNVVDDMGYSDKAPFDGEIDTPNMDALANSGKRAIFGLDCRRISKHE